MAWWAGLHGLLLLAIWAAGWRSGSSACLAAAVAAHWAARRPGSETALIVYLGAGVWALPETRRFRLALSGATGWGPGWTELRFSGEPGRVLLLADQLDARDWRRLRAAVQESLALGR